MVTPLIIRDLLGQNISIELVLLSAASILTSGTGILFGFLLKIVIENPSQYSSFDNHVNLVSLHTVTIAKQNYSHTFYFAGNYHETRYQTFDIEKFLSRSKSYLLRKTTFLMVTILGFKGRIRIMYVTISCLLVPAKHFIIIRYHILKTYRVY
jgi:hypothetical protein